MTDYFAVLNEPRRPWLDAERLKGKFLSLSAEWHPDRAHSANEEQKKSAQQRFALLNSAWQCLREPKDRLRHLLELESGLAPKTIDRAPAESMNLFLEIGQLSQKVDAFLAERAKTASPLLKAQLFERGLEWTDRLQAVQRQLQTRHEALLSELKAVDATWDQVPLESLSRAEHLPLDRLERLYRELSYLTRWAAQIQERIVQLSL